MQTELLVRSPKNTRERKGEGGRKKTKGGYSCSETSEPTRKLFKKSRRTDAEYE